MQKVNSLRKMMIKYQKIQDLWYSFDVGFLGTFYSSVSYCRVLVLCFFVGQKVVNLIIINFDQNKPYLVNSKFSRMGYPWLYQRCINLILYLKSFSYFIWKILSTFFIISNPSLSRNGLFRCPSPPKKGSTNSIYKGFIVINIWW